MQRGSLLKIGLAVLLGFGWPLAAWSQRSPQAPAATARLDAKKIERGRYLVLITGCNDCHTSGYAEAGGKIPQSDWLLGDRLGYRGPWGTTYPSNLRLSLEKLTEEQWVKRAKSLETRPPMPWFSVQAINDTDLRAMYHFIKSLGPAGEPAPDFVPAGEEPKGAYIQWPMPKR